MSERCKQEGNTIANFRIMAGGKVSNFELF